MAASRGPDPARTGERNKSMARREQIERFFEGTGVQVDDMQQGRDGFIHLINGELELTISSDVGAHPTTREVNQPKLTIEFGRRL